MCILKFTAAVHVTCMQNVLNQLAHYVPMGFTFDMQHDDDIGFTNITVTSSTSENSAQMIQLAQLIHNITML